MSEIPTIGDEILRSEISTDVASDCRIVKLALMFGDGSTMVIEVKLRIPRSPELLPATDSSLSEANELMVQSTAMRLMCEFMLSPTLTRIPRRASRIP